MCTTHDCSLSCSALSGSLDQPSLGCKACELQACYCWLSHQHGHHMLAYASPWLAACPALPASDSRLQAAGAVLLQPSPPATRNSRQKDQEVTFVCFHWRGLLMPDTDKLASTSKQHIEGKCRFSHTVAMRLVIVPGCLQLCSLHASSTPALTRHALDDDFLHLPRLFRGLALLVLLMAIR